MVPGRANRTFICSVVFLDIVEYSKKPVAEQISLKERLNALLAEALKDVAANDRIILDTGDGAAVSFVGDPEDALFVCLSLRDAAGAAQAGEAPLNMRIGINLGPVKVVRDLNGQPNIIGDGINVAQRIMGFAVPNQILVSRSYYEVVSCLSDAYAKLFRYEGSRTDKHVREHEVYAVGDSTDEIRKKLELGHFAAAQPPLAETVINRLSQSATQFTENLRTRPRLGTAAVVIAILVAAVGLRGLREPAPAVPEPRPAAVAAAPAVGPPKEEPARAPAGKPAAEKAAGAPAATGERPARRKIAAAPAPAVKPAEKAATARAPAERPAATAPSATAEPGFISFAISPWGEIHVDGRRRGVSPPLREVEVSPGWHRVEVRNADFPVYAETVEVQPGARIRIKHRFR